MVESQFAQATDYTVDLVYPSSFVLGQTPLQLQWAAVTAGAAARPLTQPFSYCDLGCGDGSTLCLLAACYPQASFIGIDINPAHIELGRDRAARADIGNVSFVHASFAGLEDLDLPELDFIAAYGIYSWLSSGMQASIGAFASRKLKSDGVLAVHYSSLPGSAVRDPLDFYLKLLGNAVAGSSTERFANGLASLRKLAPFARFFQQNTDAQVLLQSIGNAPPAYVAHDVLNRQLHSFYADELHARFAGLGFSFLGSAHVLPSYPELLLTQPAFAAYRQLTAEAEADAAFREPVRDFMLHTNLRFDAFCRAGQKRSPRGDRLHRLGDFYLERAPAENDLDVRRRRSAGCAVDLCAPLYSTVLDLAAAPVVTLGELMQSGELSAFAAPDVEQAIEHLFAVGLLYVLVQPPITAEYRSDRRYRLRSPLNVLRLEETLSSNGAESLASTVLGSPMRVAPTLRLLLALLLGDDVERVWRASGGTTRKTLDQFREQVGAETPRFVREVVPKLLRLGIVEEDR
jgi:SAM-dependent methyltransferase